MFIKNISMIFILCNIACRTCDQDSVIDSKCIKASELDNKFENLIEFYKCLGDIDKLHN